MNILNSQGFSCCAVIKSSSELSVPTFFFDDREKKKKIVETALGEFEAKLKKSSVKSPPFTIPTKYAEVKLHATNKKESFLGISTAVAWEPSEYGCRIRYDVLEKGKKREEWIGGELEKTYIVAIDDDSSFFGVDRYNLELFGNATTYCGVVPKIEISNEIKKAIENGWEEYLRKMFILQRAKTVIPENKKGLFFTESLTKNISAILVKHRKDFYFLANPLADQRINNRTIFRSFNDCFIGW